MWEPQWKSLAERFRTVRCDLRGFGESPLPPERFNPADDVRQVLQTLGIDRANLVGASFGGRVALEITARWPELVDKLVLLSSEWEAIEPDLELRSFAEAEDRLLTDGDIDGAVELNVRTWLGADASADHRSLVERMQRRAFEIQLEAGEDAVLTHEEVDPAGIESPTLVISGGGDLAHFREVAAALTDRIPRAEHRVLDWSRHLPSLERPTEMERLLLDYLAD